MHGLLKQRDEGPHGVLGLSDVQVLHDELGWHDEEPRGELERHGAQLVPHDGLEPRDALEQHDALEPHDEQPQRDVWSRDARERRGEELHGELEQYGVLVLRGEQ